ncbi:MAG: stage 0 sporulation family protein [Lachnospiraceae bacterium]|nr:stage 0 sporulation family protein [Lachnospiraceae bacterium]
MTKIVGVRFRGAGKVYYFGPQDFQLKLNDQVIVDTARGLEIGTVAMVPREVEDEEITQPLKDIKRVATEEDIEKAIVNRQKEKDALRICREKVAKHNLEMKLVSAEYTFDNSKLLFYFTADGRVDFRELVKDLAAVFRTRIELRQIGVRDETKLLGGIGMCGRPLCCTTYLTDFVPVSIKMAKEQNLSLNPTKISGVCGRLMCCLKNEQETYEYLNSQLPKDNDIVTTPEGQQGQVKSVNVLRQTVRVIIEENDIKEEREYSVEELKFASRGNKANRADDVEENVEAAENQNTDKSQDRGRDKSGDRGKQNHNKKDKKKKYNNKENSDVNGAEENVAADKQNPDNKSNGDKKKKKHHKNKKHKNNRNADNNNQNAQN